MSEACVGVDVDGNLNFYVETDEGAKLALSADQQALIKVSFFLSGKEIRPAETVAFTTGGHALADRLGWSVERVKRVCLELQQLGILELEEIAP